MTDDGHTIDMGPVSLPAEAQPEAREIRRLEASAAAGDALIREILEALCRRDGLPMESSVVPGEPARNYDLAMRLGIGHVFGVGGHLWVRYARNAEPSRTESPAPVPAGPGASSTDAAEGPWAESPGVALIAAERSRQVTAKGYTPEHDAEHGGGELAEAAVAYALAANGDGAYREFWPFRGDAFQPGGPVRALTKAGALIAAELDRLLAITGTGEGTDRA